MSLDGTPTNQVQLHGFVFDVHFKIVIFGTLWLFLYNIICRHNIFVSSPFTELLVAEKATSKAMMITVAVLIADGLLLSDVLSILFLLARLKDRSFSSSVEFVPLEWSLYPASFYHIWPGVFLQAVETSFHQLCVADSH